MDCLNFKAYIVSYESYAFNSEHLLKKGIMSL